MPAGSKIKNTGRSVIIEMVIATKESGAGGEGVEIVT